MRAIAIGSAAALVLAALASTCVSAAKAPPAPTISKEDRATGMAAAPGLIVSGHIDCRQFDARKLREIVDLRTGLKSIFYELACTGNEGVVVEQTGNASLEILTCLESSQPGPDGKPSAIACRLPGNADPKAGLAPYIAKTGVRCTPDQARPVGHSSTVTVFELVCHEAAGGYVLETSAPPRLDQPATMSPCIKFVGSANVMCTLTDRATQLSVLSVVDKLVASSGTTCTIKPDGRAFVRIDPNGKMYYEVACYGGTGYILEQAPTGAFVEAVDCIHADSISYVCKLTNTRPAETELNDVYSPLAKRAGYNCDVSGYEPLPLTADTAPYSQVVEMTCSNRPDGAIAIFPPNSADTATVLDCAHSELEGYSCTLSRPSAAYGKLTAELVSFGKTSCTVSDARAVGATADNRGYTEVTCSEGRQGFMIDYSVRPLAVKNVIVCSEAKGIGGGCTLPGNTGRKG
jgi:hypothetical protein